MHRIKYLALSVQCLVTRLILPYLLGLCFGFGSTKLRIKRRYSYLSAFIFAITSSFLISWASTYAELPLSYPFWVGWPPGSGTIPEMALLSLNFFDQSIVSTSYWTIDPYWTSRSYSSAASLILLHMYVVDALSELLGLATVLVPYIYWVYPGKTVRQ